MPAYRERLSAEIAGLKRTNAQLIKTINGSISTDGHQIGGEGHKIGGDGHQVRREGHQIGGDGHQIRGEGYQFCVRIEMANFEVPLPEITTEEFLRAWTRF